MKALQKCFRLEYFIMDDLLEQRVSGCQVYGVTGVDVSGPFYYKPEVRYKTLKMLRECFQLFFYQCRHLELVKDLSTSTFLHALKRFTTQRNQFYWS